MKSIGFLPLLALLFIGLKLAGIIGWSWLWVLSPMWLPIALSIFCIVVWLIFGSIFYIVFKKDVW